MEVEISLMKDLAHPNIVRYLDAQRSGSHPNMQLYIVLEYIAGGSLRQMVCTRPAISFRFVCRPGALCSRVLL